MQFAIQPSNDTHQSRVVMMMSPRSAKRFVYLLVFVALTSFILNVSLAPNGGALVGAEKKSDILFLKGKFILKDKKGSIIISDDKKCECPHYYKK